MTCAPWHLLRNLPYRVPSPAWVTRIQRSTLHWIDTFPSIKRVRPSEGCEDDSIWGVFLEILIQWVWNNVWEFVYLRNRQLIYILGNFGIIAEWMQRNQGFFWFIFVCLFFYSTRGRLLCLGLVVIFYPWKCLLLAKCLACWRSCSGFPRRPVKLFCLKNKNLQTIQNLRAAVYVLYMNLVKAFLSLHQNVTRDARIHRCSLVFFLCPLWNSVLLLVMTLPLKMSPFSPVNTYLVSGISLKCVSAKR